MSLNGLVTVLFNRRNNRYETNFYFAVILKPPLYVDMNLTLEPTDKGLIDASSGGSLANKTPEEAWQLIADVADANQHFKTRTITSKSLFEISTSESALTKTLGEMMSILKEIRQGQ
ncbi:hypothetical protein PIB30_054100 [Stylosanthes scabra]|uniref:Uncharacterized protein n=1 Tax=Stylosanthes scabra TaxID=79078 RepID=A0ABU6RJ16_9FABA|nr:hypothetical protein [Stylosanthes scabra]